MIATAESLVRDLVRDDYRAAAVFEQFGIDFCCGGGRTLREACTSRALKTEEVLEQLRSICGEPDCGFPRFSLWDAGTLIAYIVGNHHAYVRRAMPAILAHTQKVARSHGAKHPEFHEIALLFASVASEMTVHMAKEEQVLFPYLAAAARATREGRPVPPAPFGALDDPIRIMEEEHASVGAAMARIRDLAAGYAIPADACVTTRACLQELEAFERDLHVHVHLENNVLFPRALEAEVASCDECVPKVASEVGMRE